MTAKQFFKNRWHLHLLTLPISLLVVYLIKTYNFLYLLETGKFFQVFVITFVAACTAFAIERIQSIKMGGYRTPEQQKASDLDTLVGIIGALVGSVIGVLLI
jgi:uncharacterized membrane protein